MNYTIYTPLLQGLINHQCVVTEIWQGQKKIRKTGVHFLEILPFFTFFIIIEKKPDVAQLNYMYFLAAKFYEPPTYSYRDRARTETTIAVSPPTKMAEG